MSAPTRSPTDHRDLPLYQKSFDAAMEIYHLSKAFPDDERDSLTDQIRRSSRSVCANLAEAWRKRRYKGAFVAKLSDAEAEAAETQTWVDFAIQCHFIDADTGKNLSGTYGQILHDIVVMANNAAVR